MLGPRKLRLAGLLRRGYDCDEADEYDWEVMLQRLVLGLQHGAAFVQWSFFHLSWKQELSYHCIRTTSAGEYIS